MDFGMVLVELILNFLITVFAYLLVPSILVLWGIKFRPRTIIKINIINCIVVWLLFQIIQIELGNNLLSGVAVILWGSVSYWMLKKYCTKEEHTTCTPSTQSSEQKEPVRFCLSNEDEFPRAYGTYNVPGSELKLDHTTELSKEVLVHPVSEFKTKPVHTSPSVAKKKTKYCSSCGQVVDPVTKKCNGCGKQYFTGISWKTVANLILLVLFLASVAENFILYKRNIELKAETETLNKTIEALNSNVATLKEDKVFYFNCWTECLHEIAFYDKYVVFVEDDGTNMYHKFDCSKFAGEGFWAFNIDAAIDEGYDPCPLCCG